jgi:hypothetical protein
MENFQPFGKILIILGIVLVVLGVILSYANKIPYIGRLPGDLVIQKKNLTIYIPITSLIIINILLFLLFAIFRKQ